MMTWGAFWQSLNDFSIQRLGNALQRTFDMCDFGQGNRRLSRVGHKFLLLCVGSMETEWVGERLVLVLALGQCENSAHLSCFCAWALSPVILILVFKSEHEYSNSFRLVVSNTLKARIQNDT